MADELFDCFNGREYLREGLIRDPQEYQGKHRMRVVHELGQLQNLVYYNYGFGAFVRADTLEPICP